jgi:pimeloyl-ACP methyl ester carboxylesterase
MLTWLAVVWQRFGRDCRKFFYRKLSSRTLDTLLTESLISDIPYIELEHHWVQTEDGYSLLMHRLRHRNNKLTDRVVLMQHGLMETSAVYVLRGEDSLALKLVRQGYDVWLGNNRSNLYGQIVKSHAEDSDYIPIKLHHKIDEENFWRYSIDDLIKYDFPAMTKYIQKTTGIAKIDFIGQSQGTSQAICSMCVIPELKNCFRTLVLLSPALFLKKAENWILRILLKVPVSLMGTQEFLILVNVFQLILPPLLSGLGGLWIVKLLGFLCQPLGSEASWQHVSKWFSGIPIGATSVNNMQHWFEMLKSGGCIKTFEGEEYAIQKMLEDWQKNASVETFHCPNIMVVLGGADCVVDYSITSEVFKKCYPSGAQYKCEVLIAKTYGHIDFLWSGKSGTEELYEKMLNFMIAENSKRIEEQLT